jgi:uncharacterized protein HemX
MIEMQSRPDTSNRSAFWPLLILGLATASWSGFQTHQLAQEHEALKKLHANQETLVQNAVKLRAQLDGIAADTQRLADAGNANAQGIVNELRRRGVTINPDSPSSAGGGAESKK